MRRSDLPRTVPPEASAKEAGLRYLADDVAGITRIATGDGFRYIDPHGEPVRDKATLQRIRSLVIPPAWTDVWICPIADGHLQATGRDAKGRKQYRYHPLYRSAREHTKYERMILFGKLLPAIRDRIQHDLGLRGMPKEKVLATVVRLMDLAHLRVGNEEYARANHSYGLTTMRDEHVEVEGSVIHFRFKGKSGKFHDLQVNNKRLASIVARCRDLPGYELFHYVDENGETVSVDSSMVNQYLREITGEDITAKDFRTWHGTVHAAEQLGSCGTFSSEAEMKRNVVSAIRAVADRLGNRPATCRKYYVHPMVLEAYVNQTLEIRMTALTDAPDTGLTSAERCVLKMLEAAPDAYGAPSVKRKRSNSRSGKPAEAA